MLVPLHCAVLLCLLYTLILCYTLCYLLCYLLQQPGSSSRASPHPTAYTSTLHTVGANSSSSGTSSSNAANIASSNANIGSSNVNFQMAMSPMARSLSEVWL
jgi:hypothetical protein